jgi:hypothetical protein
MTKVYVVTKGKFSDYRIVAVFSTREGAENMRAGPCDPNVEVQEWELDALAKHEWGMNWYADIRLGDGLVRQRYEVEGFRHPTETDVNFHSVFANAPPSLIQVRSPISAEHAVKVAVEKRQEWLRTKELAGETG